VWSVIFAPDYTQTPHSLELLWTSE